MYVESVTMTDFRCFEKAKGTFVSPGKEGLPEDALDNVTLLMGINGAGKTSTLRGVALALLSPIIGQSGLYPRYLVRRTSTDVRDPIEEAKIKCVINDDEECPFREIRFPGVDKSYTTILIRTVQDTEYFNQYSWCGNSQIAVGNPTLIGTRDLVNVNENDLLSSFYSESSPEYFLLGYGASRRTEFLENLDSQRSRRRHPRFQRVAGLFEEFITLYPLAAWFPLLKTKARAKEVRELLNRLLPDGTTFTGECKEGDGLFEHHGVTLPFSALSDGYRSYIGLVADMLYHMQYVCTNKMKLTSLSGVVMIDDIDVHLHPEWQRIVVPKLATTFPKLQFIITSHSPLVVGTLHAANIRVVEDNQIHEYADRVHSLSADQILTSRYFGLSSARSPDAEKTFNRKAKRVADNHDPKAALEFIRELTGKTNGKKPSP